MWEILSDPGLVSALFFMAVMFLFIVYMTWDTYTKRTRNLRHIIAGAPLVCVILVIAFFCGLPDKSMVMRDNQIVALYPKSSLVLRWKLRGLQTISYDSSPIEAVKQVEALTANPGIRRVMVHVQLRSGGTPESELAYLNSDWPANAQDKLRSLMNRFDKVNHSWVAENCFDDTDRQQQKALQDMVMAFMSPELVGKGLKLESAYFNLPN